MSDKMKNWLKMATKGPLTPNWIFEFSNFSNIHFNLISCGLNLGFKPVKEL